MDHKFLKYLNFAEKEEFLYSHKYLVYFKNRYKFDLLYFEVITNERKKGDNLVKMSIFC